MSGETPHYFVCDGCGGFFQSERPDAVAIATFERDFKRPFDRSKVKEVCSKCLKRLLGEQEARH
jgi:hypothetical protein